MLLDCYYAYVHSGIPLLCCHICLLHQGVVRRVEESSIVFPGIYLRHPLLTRQPRGSVSPPLPASSHLADYASSAGNGDKHRQTQNAFLPKIEAITSAPRWIGLGGWEHEGDSRAQSCQVGRVYPSTDQGSRASCLSRKQALAQSCARCRAGNIYIYIYIYGWSGAPQSKAPRRVTLVPTRPTDSRQSGSDCGTADCKARGMPDRTCHLSVQTCYCYARSGRRAIVRLPTFS